MRRDPQDTGRDHRVIPLAAGAEPASSTSLLRAADVSIGSNIVISSARQPLQLLPRKPTSGCSTISVATGPLRTLIGPACEPASGQLLACQRRLRKPTYSLKRIFVRRDALRRHNHADIADVRHDRDRQIGPRQSAKRWRDKETASGALYELSYATNREGKASSLPASSSIDLMLTMVSKQQSHLQHRQR